MIIRTWHLELGFVGTVLGVVLAVTLAPAVEVVGALAVLASFAHAQVADRMAEHAKLTDAFVGNITGRGRSLTDCWRWSTRYFVTKEALWLAYFVAHRSWAALVGVGVFLAYPLWRTWWRRTVTS